MQKRNMTNNPYGSIEEAPLQMNPQHATARSGRNSRLFLGLNIAILCAVMFGCVTLNNSLAKYEKIASLMEQNLLAQSSRPLESSSSAKVEILPSKYSIKHVTPRKDQARRGTCWDFATIGLLEQTYRENGIKNGWLNKDDYVAFSEQAYGAEVLKLCAGPPNSAQQIACRVAGDSMWQNSTEGGEVPELLYLMNGLKNAVLPHSQCPYYTQDGHDTVCPNMQENIKTNPLKFSIKKMYTKFDDLSVKRHLFQKKTAMTYSTPMAYVTHYYPCIGKFKNDPRCDENSDKCTLCPPDMSMTTCCVPIKGGSNRNMEGEFLSHRGMTIEGGHAMLLVGYNDAFQTRDGFNGGFIVKNSWADGPHQGSHSLRYWMQEISDWEERVICPNSYNPFNWYQCGNSAMSSPISDSFNRSNAFNEGVEACLSHETKLYAKINYQSLDLKCTNGQHCDTNPNVTYFVRNTTDWGDRMTVMCIWELNEVNHTARDYCLTPMLELDIARTLRPVEVKENDPDRCGFYFFPYEAVRKHIALFQGWFINSFDITWDPQSYLANKDRFPKLNYNLIKESTKRQNPYKFNGPFPFAKVVKQFPEAK